MCVVSLLQEAPAEVNESQQSGGEEAAAPPPVDKKKEKEEQKRLEKERKEHEKREKEETKRLQKEEAQRKKDEERVRKEQEKGAKTPSPKPSPQKSPPPQQQGVRSGKMVRVKVYLLEDKDYEVDIDVSMTQVLKQGGITFLVSAYWHNYEKWGSQIEPRSCSVKLWLKKKTETN